MTSSEKGGLIQNKVLSDAQLDFLRTCKEIGWGKLEVLVKDGEPTYSRLLEKTYQHKKPNH